MLLAPCSWNIEPRITVNPGDIKMLDPIQLQTGVDFHVQVNDPKGLTAAATAKGAGGGLMLCARPWADLSHPDDGSRRRRSGYHHLLVPASTNLAFTAFSNVLSMTNSLGQAISKTAGQAVTVNIPQGQTQHTEVINVK